MSKPLVIVESPTKVKTISKILGPDYIVRSSVGHIRDLPRNTKSIPSKFDSKKILWGAVKPGNFENIYVIPEDRKKIVRELKEISDTAPEVYLATDDDREGEAIAYHLKEALEIKGEPKRIKFNEITESAVTKAMSNPDTIDVGKFKSYEARRTLDRMIGYEISPKVRDLGGAFISTGRVQGPAIRLIVEREEERLKFVKSLYFEIKANCGSSEVNFDANLKKVGEKRIATSADFNDKGEKTNKDKKYLNKNDAEKIVEILTNSIAKISNIKESSRSGKPPKPFKTTSLQTSARSNLGFQPKKTMGIAQRLYQGVDIEGETTGLITYMRTDGTNISKEAIDDFRKFITDDYGDKYLPEAPNSYTGKKAKNAQEAHEAIRPTNISRKPSDIKKYVNADQFKLYELIWSRALSSQMTPAEFDRNTIIISSNDNKINFRASGSVVKFDGFLKVYQVQETDEDAKNILPEVKVGEEISILKLNDEQHFTDPPPRYSEASLVKKMEELGIGRPSTYASIISVLSTRNYVELINKRFNPTDRGKLISAFLEKLFSKYVDYNFTADLENQLDEITSGKIEWVQVLDNFWKDFYENVGKVKEKRTREVLDLLNESLGALIFERDDKDAIDRKCKLCSNGELSLKNSFRGGAFIGCSNYPECKFTRPLSKAKAVAQSQLAEPKFLGKHENGNDIYLKNGRFGPYLQYEKLKDEKLEEKKNSTS